MPTGEHVHIISAGENIHIAYPVIFRTLPTITCTYVLAHSDIYGISQNAEIEKQRQAVAGDEGADLHSALRQGSLLDY